jgi:hypothetical protein
MVRSRDAAGNEGPWSLLRSATIIAPFPSNPMLSAPATGTLTNSNTPMFSWTVAQNADAYEIQLASNSAFTIGTQSFMLSSGTLVYSPGALVDGTYYWRVRGYNLNIPAEAGSWSAYRYLVIDTTPSAIPVQSMPSHGASAVGMPTFSWLRASGASQYRLQIDEADFSSPIYDGAWTTALSLRPSGLTDLGAMNWRVKSRDAAGNESDWSTVRSLTVNPPLAVAPTPGMPSPGLVTSDQTPQFAWSTVAYAEYSEIWIDNVSTFTSPLVDQYLGVLGEHNTGYLPTNPLGEGLYYWKVRSYNSLGQPSAWSKVLSFTVDIQAPAAPGITQPVDGLVSRAAPLHRWTAVSGASQYQIEYDEQGEDFSSPVYTSAWISGTSFTSPFNTLGVYSWHIRSRDAALNVGNWSSTRIVTIIAPLPAAPMQISPRASATMNDNSPSFSWNAVIWGDTYQIQIDNASNFSSPEASVTLSSGVLSYTSVVLADGRYYWRVRAINVQNEPGAWSAARLLIIGAYP